MSDILLSTVTSQDSIDNTQSIEIPVEVEREFHFPKWRQPLMAWQHVANLDGQAVSEWPEIQWTNPVLSHVATVLATATTILGIIGMVVILT